jgi:hypothetical protein
MDVWMKGRRPEILALRPAATQVRLGTIAASTAAAAGVFLSLSSMMIMPCCLVVIITPPPIPTSFAADVLGLLWVIRCSMDRRRHHGQVVVAGDGGHFGSISDCGDNNVSVIVLCFRVVMPPEHAHIFR